MAKKYIVRLTEAERTDLEGLIHKGKVAAHKRLHAEILLKADISELGEKWLDSQISEAFAAIQSIIKIQQSEPLPFYSEHTLASPWLESAVLRYQSG